MPDAIHGSTDLSSVPLFPLPNMVLFPRAVVPLHIFGERYRVMTADALAGPRRIAMAHLKQGWEKDYYGRPAIDPIVCVGTILTWESLPGGKYNFLLQGQLRARVISETAARPYRIAHLEPLEEITPDEQTLLPFRRRIMAAFDEGSLLATVIGRQFRQLLASALPTADIADLIAFNFLEDDGLKQSLLSEPDVLRRVSQTVTAFEAIKPALEVPAFKPQEPNMN